MFVEDLESAKYYDALPRFTKEIYDYLETLGIKNKVIADIGSGTGRIAIDLLERGNTVCCVDLDENMRNICDKKCNSFKDRYISVNGSDIKMNLKTKSIDYVITSQSFHRFNPIRFKNECNRVLKDNKNIIIIWYRVDFSDPIIKDMLTSLKNNYKNYETRYNKSEIDGSKEEELLNNESAIKFFNNQSIMKEIYSKPLLNEEEFITLGLSLSLFPITHEMNTVTKVINSKEFNKEEYIKDLKSIFKKYSKDNKIELIFKVQIHSHN